MVIAKERETEDVFEKKHQTLVSTVTQLAPIDPFSFFAAGAKHYRGKRFYWSDPGQEKVFVGLGIAHEIVAHGDDRFAKVEEERKKLLNMIETETDLTIQGTGPLLFGGFSFDSQAAKTALWRSFPDASFVVPVFLLTVTRQGCWLTVNRLVQAGDHSIQEKWLEKERESLLRNARAAVLSDGSAQSENVRYATTDVEPEAWKRAVAEAVDQIRNGEVDKVALAREIRVHATERIDVVRTLKRLCKQQKESYVFAVERGTDCFLGASPEQLVKRDGNKLHATCLASSIGRGKTAEEDERLGQRLLSDEKFIVEHQFVVDMIKSAMEAECEDVSVPNEPSLFKTAYIQHLYTPVTGTARRGTSLLSMVEKLHPTPALGGYPQDVAVRKIREMEKLDRGWYASPLGWMDRHGNGEFIGAIRSGIVRGNEVSLFVGNGIVADSDPESEYEETKLKPKPMLTALGGKRS